MTPQKQSLPALNAVDREIVLALHGAGRDSWDQIAEKISCSASTARRRFDALTEAGLVRVIGATDVRRLGVGTPVILRFRALPHEISGFTDRLRARSEVRFLAAVAGSADCVAEIVLPHLRELVDFTSELVAGTSIATEGFVVTHTYTSGQDWLPGTPETAHRVVSEPAGPAVLSRIESAVLSRLMTNGRMPLGVLAEEAGCSQRAAAKAIESLIERNLLDYRVLVEPALLGYQAECFVWLEVEPSSLKAAGLQLAAHPATKYLSATTGRRNLVGQIALDDIAAIYDYTHSVLGALPGVRSVDLTPHVYTAKRVWTQVADGRYEAPTGPVELVETLGARTTTRTSQDEER